MEKSRELFVANIIRLRNRQGLTQTDAAEGAGVSLRTYQKYEAGQVFPSSPTLLRLAETFKVPQSDLFAEENQPREFTQDKASLIGSISMRLPMLSEQELRTLLNLIDARLPENSEAKLKA